MSSAETHSLFPNAFRRQQLRVVGNLATKLSVGEFDDPNYPRRLMVHNLNGAIKVGLYSYGGEFDKYIRMDIEVTPDEDMFSPPFIRAQRQIFSNQKETVAIFDANPGSENGLSLFSVGLSLIRAKRLINASKKRE